MEQTTEREEVAQEEPQPPDESERLLRKKLQLDWVESEWFQVWLKLARGEHQK